MTNKIIPIIICAFSVIFGNNTHAQTNEEARIEHLINSVKNTPKGTSFIRNGKEYSAEKAAAHLRTKYRRGKKYAGTAELFIENLASKSSITKVEYRIKFADGKIVTAHEYFTEELKKLKE